MREIKARKLKRTVIKEEFVAVTSGFLPALILKKCVFWSERLKDFDDFIAGENERRKQSNIDTITLLYGRFCKSAVTLNQLNNKNSKYSGMSQISPKLGDESID